MMSRFQVGYPLKRNCLQVQALGLGLLPLALVPLPLQAKDNQESFLRSLFQVKVVRIQNPFLTPHLE